MSLSEKFKQKLSEKLMTPFPRLNYISYPNLDSKSIYFETPKVACTAIKMSILWNKDPKNKLIKPHKIHAEAQEQLIRLRDMEEDIINEMFFGNYFRFAFIRSPYTRILSSYLDKIVANEYERKRLLPNLGIKENKIITFKHFLELISLIPDQKRDIHFMSQSELLMINKINYNFLGRFENFESDFKFVLDEVLKIEYFNDLKSKSKHHSTNANSIYKEYFTTEIENMCKQIYINDIENFGY